MTRQNVSQQQKSQQQKSQQQKSTELFFEQLQESAKAFVKERLCQICSAAKNVGAPCTCANLLPNLFVEAIKALPTHVNRDGQSAQTDGDCLTPRKQINAVDGLSIDALCDGLSAAYEHLLLYTVLSEANRPCSFVPIEKSKKRLGNFYTPRSLASFTVEKALQQLVFDDSGQLKIVDPSMGCGMFLSAALAYLGERLFESRSGAVDLYSCREDVLLNCLYGVDLDPAAVQVARYLLALQCRTKRQDTEIALEQKLKCGDSLVGLMPCATLHSGSQTGADAREIMSFEDADNSCNELLGLSPGTTSPFKYFHWTLQFSEIFEGANPGFDAVLGNPPWEIWKPNSREFFQQKDEQYWTRGKQDALRRQNELRTAQHIDDEWNRYQNNYKMLSRWISQCKYFCLQGTSDLNAYKLFVELSLMLAKSEGVVSLIVPSSLYSDKGSAELRRALLLRNDWISLSTFQNLDGIFDIHRSFKFCVFLVRKAGVTSALKARFDARDVDAAHQARLFKLDIRQLKTFSPNWLSVPEVESNQDLQIVDKISSNCIRFDDFAKKFELKFRREFDMTNDSHKFIERDVAERIGYKADSLGRWLLGKWSMFDERLQDVRTSKLELEQPNIIVSADGAFVIGMADIIDLAFPLYEGRMIGQFDVAEKGWVHGKGRQALWSPVSDKRILPQYLVSQKNFDAADGDLKVGFLGVGSATNTRSMIAACLGGYPCGNSVPTIQCPDPRTALVLTACLNSFVFDYLLRMRLVGNNLNYFILQETFLPDPERLLADPEITEIAARLSFNDNHHAPALRKYLPEFAISEILSEKERTRLRCLLDALIADLYGLDVQDFEHVLRGCGRHAPTTKTSKPDALEPKLSPRGFWRVDKNKAPETRQTVQTLNAFRALKEFGRSGIGLQTSGAGWKVPAADGCHI
jgi:N-6 DNA Methylase